MGMFPDIGKIQGELNQKFDVLIAEIRKVQEILIEIRDKGQA